MPEDRPRRSLVFALTAGGAALGVAGTLLLKPPGTAAVAALADALVKQALFNGPIVATGIAATAAIAGAVIVPAVVVYALCKWGK